jgi:hypothetical protein
MMNRSGQPDAGVTMTRARLARLALNVLGVAGATVLVAILFPPHLMFADTTATGGDLGSHNYAAAMARDLLLHDHRLTGWIPGNFCGFPLFQIYFPLPFVVSTLGSLVVAPHVAFKLTSVLGLLLLPAAAFACLWLRRVPFPGPALGACATVLFLFQAGNSAWGGNLQSTMAGEFAFSISLPIALLFLGIIERAFGSIRWSVTAAAMVALLALTHAYTVLWVALAAAVAVPVRGRPIASGLWTAAVFVAGGAFCAFWLLPLLWYSPWTTAFKHLWVIGSPMEVAPPLLWPVIAAAVAGPLLLAWTDRSRLPEYARATGLLWAGFIAAVLAYGAAPNFGVVDVRFLPFAQLTIALLGAVGLTFAVRRWPASGLWIPIALVGVAALTQSEAHRIEAWVRWNYQGFEGRSMWPVLSGIAGHVRGTAADPRVVYEHSPDNEALGTIRAFENLPLFSGRSTLEGVNFQASVTAPFVFYVQSEISEVMSCPFAEWGCSRPDLASGLEHLAMMNVSDLILRSDAMKRAAAREATLTRTGAFGPYEVYHLIGRQSGYVQPLAVRPYLVRTSGWKDDAYRWFKRARADDPLPLFVDRSTDVTGLSLAGVFEGRPALDAVPSEPVDPSGAAHVEEHVDAERIQVSGCRPGQPLLIRVSYHPRWRATTGERIWLAGPGFMVVFPRGHELELVYGTGPPVTLGTVITLAAIGAGLVLAVWAPRPRRLSTLLIEPGAGSRRRRRIAALGLCVSCGLLSAGTGMRARHMNADATYLRGLTSFNRGTMGEARGLFRLAQARAPLSNTAIHSTYFEAVSLYRTRQWAEARRVFRRLVDQFPEAQAAAESSYHQGLCAEQLGKASEAKQIYAATEQRFSGSSWADLARTRRSALGGA